METYIIMPDGTLQKDEAGTIPANCPLDEIVFEELGRHESVRWFHMHSAMDSAQLDEVYRLPSHARVGRPSQFHRYIKMRLDNQSHNIALMLATRSFPGVKTDAIFNEGKFSGESGSIPAEQLWLRDQAESRGVATNGKWYCHGLARYPGDPKAWVGDRGDVTRIAAENNMTVNGYVQHKGYEVEPTPDIDIDPTLIHDETLDVMDSNPGLKYEDVYEKLHEVRTGRVDNNPLLVED